MSTNPVRRKSSRHIDIRVHFCRELYTAGVMLLIPLRTHLMVANTLTKSLPDPALSHHREVMMGHAPFYARILHQIFSACYCLVKDRDISAQLDSNRQKRSSEESELYSHQKNDTLKRSKGPCHQCTIRGIILLMRIERTEVKDRDIMPKAKKILFDLRDRTGANPKD